MTRDQAYECLVTAVMLTASVDNHIAELAVDAILDRERRGLLAKAADLYTADDVAHFQTTEALLVTEPLRKEIRRLHKGIEQAVESLEGELATQQQHP